MNVSMKKIDVRNAPIIIHALEMSNGITNKLDIPGFLYLFLEYWCHCKGLRLLLSTRHYANQSRDGGNDTGISL